VTPSARDLIRDRGVKLSEVPIDQLDKAPPEKIVALGSDHGGFVLKKMIAPLLAELGLHVIDLGTDSEKPVDYPDIAASVAEAVASGKASRGIIIDGAGIGSAMVANKFAGVRAALCYDRASASNSREDNDSNVLTLWAAADADPGGGRSARVIATPFAGGRHAARVAKIAEIEKATRNWTPRS
jgi:ribose 5-phosphate isomerase B